MTRRRLGCLSGSGLIAVALTLLLSLGVVLARGGVWFSPGALNAQTGETQLGGVVSHAATGGQCDACHTAPWDRTTMAERCLVCHTDIAVELGDSTSMHGGLKVDQAAMDCRLCHTEHRGATVSLTSMDPATFPHEVVGYTLAGHAQLANGHPFACTDCHTDTLARFDVATCDTCHREIDSSYMQVHVADFGADCLGCHDGADRYGKQRFDHNQLAFPLTGKHVDAPCAGCHVDARTVAELQAAPQDCVACHAKDDEHDGQFGTDCAACHTTETWEDATFDHSKSAFPLTGKHTDVACESCHVDNVFKDTPQDCVSCHEKDDEHDGQFGTDCVACHTTETWEDATFDHSKSAFPLTGKHTDVACESCHVDNVFEGTPQSCVACHQDPAFHVAVFGDACTDCHSTDAWSPARFDRQHTFPVDHGESGVSSCQTCHPTQVQAYTCYGCHEHDPAVIEREHLDEGISDFLNCMECHPTGQEEDGEGGGGGDD